MARRHSAERFMRRPCFNSGYVAIMLAFLLVGLKAATPAAHAAVTAIAMTGTPVPEGNGEISVITALTLGNANEVGAFAAILQNTSGGTVDDFGLYLFNGTSLVTIARENAPLPEGNGQFLSLGTPLSNAQGQVAFSTSLQNTSGGANDDTGLYLHNGTSLLNLSRENSAVPGGNGLFADYNGPFAFNNAGQLAFRATLRNTSGGLNDDTGVFLHDGTGILSRARENNSVPEGNGQFSSFGPLALNDLGRIAFHATLRNTSGGTNDDSGVYLHNGSNLVNRARENAAVPEGNGLFASFGDPSLNSAGLLAFTATLRNTSGGTNDDSGVYLHNQNALINLTRENDIVPELDGRFAQFGNVLLNGDKHVAFSAILRNTSGGSSNDSGIYLHNGTSLVKLVREDEPVPDGNGKFDSVFSIPVSFNAAGLAIISATLRNTSGGVDDNQGLYLADGVETVKVARRGDILVGKTIVQTGIQTGSGGQDGKPTALNDLGQVLFRSTLSDGTQGLFLFTPELRWRSPGSGLWDTNSNWTLSLRPGSPHQVTIDPAGSLTVFGPTSDESVASLQIGSGAGIATLALQQGGSITPADGVLIQVNGVLTGDGAIHGDLLNLGRVRPNNLSINGVLNQGIIEGDGVLTTLLFNQTSGQIRAAADQRLRFAGAASQYNFGLIEALGSQADLAEIEFDGSLFSSGSSALITGRNAVFRFNGGLSNASAFAVSGGTADIFGDVTNLGSINNTQGNLVVTGGAHAVIYGDVVQNGTLRVSKVGSTTSVAVFLGEFSGSGGSTGGGDIFFEGDLRPGNSTATVTFENNVALGSGAILNIELGGTTPGADYDQVHVTGELALGGTLQVTLDYVPIPGDSFDILDWGTLTGTFDVLQLPALSGDLQWNTSQLYTGGILSVASPTANGDFNGDHTVNAADYVLWRKTPNQYGGNPDGYHTWRANFGITAGSGSAASHSSAIPEPSTLVVFLCAMPLLLTARLSRHRC